MMTEVTDDTIRVLLDAVEIPAHEGLGEYDGQWTLGGLQLSKYLPDYSDGWGHSLRPESRFYKRWFDFPDLGTRGWAIILRIFDPTEDGAKYFESYRGWVPPEREEEVDVWIEFLNAEIRDRVAGVARPTFLDDLIETFVRSSKRRPLDRLAQPERLDGPVCEWGVGDIESAQASFFIRPTSKFFKRWFDLPQLGLRGWAIICRIDRFQDRDIVMFPGWVPPEREADADRWIAHFNSLIQEYLHERKP